jgi:hypothetical protein
MRGTARPHELKCDDDNDYPPRGVSSTAAGDIEAVRNKV